MLQKWMNLLLLWKTQQQQQQQQQPLKILWANFVKGLLSSAHGLVKSFKKIKLQKTRRRRTLFSSFNLLIEKGASAVAEYF